MRLKKRAAGNMTVFKSQMATDEGDLYSGWHSAKPRPAWRQADIDLDSYKKKLFNRDVLIIRTIIIATIFRAPTIYLALC